MKFERDQIDKMLLILSGFFLRHSNFAQFGQEQTNVKTAG